MGSSKSRPRAADGGSAGSQAPRQFGSKSDVGHDRGMVPVDVGINMLKLFGSLKSERLIAQIKEAGDPNSDTAQKAADALRAVGPKAIPKIVDANTGEVTNRAMAKARPNYSLEFINQRYSPYGGLWASVYGAGSYTDARHALLCFYRFRQIQHEEYRSLVLATADRYVESRPEPLEGTLTPKTLAPVMALLHAGWHLSGDLKYVNASRRLADQARELFFEPDIDLPFATQRRREYPYYASISYGDSLMLMFLELALILDGEEKAHPVQCTIR